VPGQECLLHRQVRRAAEASIAAEPARLAQALEQLPGRGLRLSGTDVDAQRIVAKGTEALGGDWDGRRGDLGRLYQGTQR
jgi:hypothetical protein